MKVFQLQWDQQKGWIAPENSGKLNPHWVLFFGQREIMDEGSPIQELVKEFPDAHIFGGSSAGEILGENVMDESVVATAIEFERTEVKSSSLLIQDHDSSFQAGFQLGASLKEEGLKAVFVISDGHMVNGSELVLGLRDSLPADVTITGGLAGDGDKFEKTLVSYNGKTLPGLIAGIGFYGDSLCIGHGSKGGWEPFGPQRLVTKSEGNVLYELDGKPALELYKKYLGEEADRLPASALEFPLSIKPDGYHGIGTVRTILSIDEDAGSMTFAGNMPEGQQAQLMMASFDKLIDGAAHAAEFAAKSSEANQGSSGVEIKGDKLAIMVSCVGRKIVMGQHTPEEVEMVADVLGSDVKQIGFYSYGEIAPHTETGHCELHNQTMTITYLYEYFS